MRPRTGSRAISLVALLLRRHPEVQYIRFRTYPAPSKIQRPLTPLTLARALRHERGPELLWSVPDRGISTALKRMLARISLERVMVGLCSQVETRSGTSKHALLMDFRPQKSAGSLQTLNDACRYIGYTGWLLETTQSYHFYGDDLVGEWEWLPFMGGWLLLENLIDVRFIGHCIIERVSCLRLTGNSTWSEPRVVRRVATGHAKPHWLVREG